MVRLLFFAAVLSAACGRGGRGSGQDPNEVFESDSSTEETPAAEETAQPEEPVMPADPTEPPSADTIKLVKYLLAPCTSPFASKAVERLKIGSDLLKIEMDGSKKTLKLNGVAMWEVTPTTGTSFVYDIDVKSLGPEKSFAAYQCNSIAISYPDDNNLDIERLTMEVDTEGATTGLTWHTRKDMGETVVFKIEIALPGAAPVILE